MSDLNNNQHRTFTKGFLSFVRARSFSLFLLHYDKVMRPHENDVQVCVRTRATIFSLCVFAICIDNFMFFYVSHFFPFLELRCVFSVASWTICLVFQLKASIFFCVISSLFSVFFSSLCCMLDSLDRLCICVYLFHSLKLELQIQKYYPTKQ